MSTFLEKWRVNADLASASGQPRANREEVLAMLRQDREAAAGDVFDQMCVCAVHDRPFITRYTKRPSGKFRATQCLKVQAGADSGRESTGRISRLSLGETEDGYPPCPWCGCKSNVHYQCRCGAVVCGGRVKHQIFRCRRSCGAEWFPVASARDIEGTSPSAESTTKNASPRRPAEPAKPLGETRLLADHGRSIPSRRG